MFSYICFMNNLTDLLDQLKALENDRQSGSSEILRQVVDLVKQGLSNNLFNSNRDLLELIAALSALEHNFPCFAAVGHFARTLRQATDAASFGALVMAYKQNWKNAAERAARLFMSNVELEGKTILLNSQSGSVVELFRQFAKKNGNCRIIQMESRPEYEGIKQAERLAGLGFDATLVADAAFTRYIDSIDMAILGADAICRNAFINKTGSHSVALAANAYGFPLYLLADSRKFIDRDCFQTGEHMKPSPAFGDYKLASPRVRFENFYFEIVPLKYVAGVCVESEFRRI